MTRMDFWDNNIISPESVIHTESTHLQVKQTRDNSLVNRCCYKCFLVCLFCTDIFLTQLTELQLDLLISPKERQQICVFLKTSIYSPEIHLRVSWKGWVDRRLPTFKHGAHSNRLNRRPSNIFREIYTHHPCSTLPPTGSEQYADLLTGFWTHLQYFISCYFIHLYAARWRGLLPDQMSDLKMKLWKKLESG